MPQDNNQPTSTQQETSRLQGWPLDNFIFIAESLKIFKFGEEFNNEVYQGIAKDLPQFELARNFNLPKAEAVQDLNTMFEKEPVRFTLRFEKIDTDAGKMHVLKQIEASLLKDNKPAASATFRVFQKTGFTASQMRNLLHDRTVTHQRISQKTSKPYTAYTKVNLSAPKDDKGNSQLVSVPSFRQEFDLAKLLGKASLPGNFTQENINDLGRRLGNGDIVPIGKRGAGGATEIFYLFAAPQDDALMNIDKNGEIRKITAPTMEVIKDDQTMSQQQSQEQPLSNGKNVGKAAETASKMEEAPNSGQTQGKRTKAA